MTNILVNDYYIDSRWCRKQIGQYLHKESKVVIVPFSFQDSVVRTKYDMERYYGKYGLYYDRMVKPLLSYGIKEEDITVLNYFDKIDEDIIKEADVVYLTAGNPDKMMERLEDSGILTLLNGFDKTIIGCGEGALLQLERFHITPGEEYAEYSCHNGLGYVSGFDMELNFDHSYGQKMAIRRALLENKKKVYAMTGQGAIVVKDGEVCLIGDVILFDVTA